MHSPRSFRCNVCTMYPFFSSLSFFLMYMVHHLALCVYTDIVYYYAKAQSHSLPTYQSYQSSSVSIACGKSSTSFDVVCIQIHLIYVGPHLNARCCHFVFQVISCITFIFGMYNYPANWCCY